MVGTDHGRMMGRGGAGLAATFAFQVATVVTLWAILAAISVMGRPSFSHYVIALPIAVAVGGTATRRIFGLNLEQLAEVAPDRDREETLAQRVL